MIKPSFHQLQTYITFAICGDQQWSLRGRAIFMSAIIRIALWLIKTNQSESLPRVVQTRETSRLRRSSSSSNAIKWFAARRMLPQAKWLQWMRALSSYRSFKSRRDRVSQVTTSINLQRHTPSFMVSSRSQSINSISSYAPATAVTDFPIVKSRAMGETWYKNKFLLFFNLWFKDEYFSHAARDILVLCSSLFNLHLDQFR